MSCWQAEAPVLVLVVEVCAASPPVDSSLRAW